MLIFGCGQQSIKNMDNIARNILCAAALIKRERLSFEYNVL